jgi:hypothetical protein
LVIADGIFPESEQCVGLRFSSPANRLAGDSVFAGYG